MNYQKIYNNLIQRGINRILEESVYSEKHHIIPRCMNGNNDKSNIVKLTAKEHYLAHLLLYKIYPNNDKLAFAFFTMCSIKKDGKRDYKVSSRMFAEIKESCGKIVGLRNKGIPRSQEIRNKISKSNKGKPKSLDHIKSIISSHLGIKQTEESKRKKSIALKGQRRSFVKIFINEKLIEVITTREAIDKYKCNNIWYYETRNKSFKGIIFKRITLNKNLKDIEIEEHIKEQTIKL